MSPCFPSSAYAKSFQHYTTNQGCSCEYLNSCRLPCAQVYDELKTVRNVHAGFAGGLMPGLVHAGLITHVLRGTRHRHHA